MLESLKTHLRIQARWTWQGLQSRNLEISLCVYVLFSNSVKYVSSDDVNWNNSGLCTRLMIYPRDARLCHAEPLSLGSSSHTAGTFCSC